MFNRVISYFKNIFSVNNYQNKPTKEQYIDRELQKWKLDMYTEFPFLSHIPQKRIDIQIDIIKRDYIKKYGQD